MKFKIQTNNNISSIGYTNAEEWKLHGDGQEAVNSGTRWTLEEVAPGCKLRLPKR